jgi:uncharacterized protein YkwD
VLRRPHLLALVAACACSALLLPAGTVARPTGAVGSCIAGSDWGTAKPELADRVVALVNVFRARHGLRPLHENSTLAAAAGWKARHMARYGYMSHDDPAPPVSRTTAQRIAACGYGGGGWGENIAYGYPSPEQVMEGWLNSPGHRANITNGSYTAIGVGAAAHNGRLFWAQAFGVAAPSAVRTPARTRPAVQPRPTLVTSQLFHLKRRPHAGRKYLGQILVLDKDGERVRSGRVLCRARVAGRPAWNGVHRFRRGLATCVWRTPAWAHGRRLTGTIRVTNSRGLALRWFSRRIR